MSIKQQKSIGTTSDWRGRNVVICCKGSTCLPLFLLLLRLSHLYRYAPLLQPHSLAPNISTTWLKVQQNRQWSRGSLQFPPNTPILYSPSKGRNVEDCCPPEAASSEAVVPSAGNSTYVCPAACWPWPHPCHWPICVLDPTSPCSQTDCSCWHPCYSSTCLEGLQSDRINAFSATSPATWKLSTASIMRSPLIW